MFNREELNAMEKEGAPERAKQLHTEEIRALVAWLDEKDDQLRYKAFLILQARSQIADDVYPYWNTFMEKFDSENSYQRSLGLMLIAENVRWDADDRFGEILEKYLTYCDDEKPITVRQCIQSLEKIAAYKPGAHARMVEKLTAIDLTLRKDTQRKLLLMDILNVLAEIRKTGFEAVIDAYVRDALAGTILDARSRKAAAALFPEG